jgi:DNA-binding transcriptional regulator PaaX
MSAASLGTGRSQTEAVNKTEGFAAAGLARVARNVALYRLVSAGLVEEALEGATYFYSLTTAG